MFHNSLFYYIVEKANCTDCKYKKLVKEEGDMGIIVKGDNNTINIIIRYHRFSLNWMSRSQFWWVAGAGDVF